MTFMFKLVRGIVLVHDRIRRVLYKEYGLSEIF